MMEWRIILAIVFAALAIGVMDALNSEAQGRQVPKEYEAAQHCMWVFSMAEAVQTVRNGGYDPVTGERVEAVHTFAEYVHNIMGMELAEKNPVREQNMESVGAWVYNNIPVGLDPTNAGFLAGAECLKNSLMPEPPHENPPSP